MTRVLLGIGSNIDRHDNLCIGLDKLRSDFGLQRLSSVYESAAEGFEGPPFFNLAVELETDIELTALARFLRQMEYRMGRPRNATRFSSRTLDLDILCYGDLHGQVDGIRLPRAEITENAYVLAPLAELAPTVRLPGGEENFAELWQRLGASMQPVRAVSFEWRGRVLPIANLN